MKVNFSLFLPTKLFVELKFLKAAAITTSLGRWSSSKAARVQWSGATCGEEELCLQLKLLKVVVCCASSWGHHFICLPAKVQSFLYIRGVANMSLASSSLQLLSSRSAKGECVVHKCVNLIGHMANFHPIKLKKDLSSWHRHSHCSHRTPQCMWLICHAKHWHRVI